MVASLLICNDHWLLIADCCLLRFAVYTNFEKAVKISDKQKKERKSLNFSFYCVQWPPTAKTIHFVWTDFSFRTSDCSFELLFHCGVFFKRNPSPGNVCWRVQDKIKNTSSRLLSGVWTMKLTHFDVKMGNQVNHEHVITCDEFHDLECNR